MTIEPEKPEQPPVKLSQANTTQTSKNIKLVIQNTTALIIVAIGLIGSGLIYLAWVMYNPLNGVEVALENTLILIMLGLSILGFDKAITRARRRAGRPTVDKATVLIIVGLVLAYSGIIAVGVALYYNVTYDIAVKNGMTFITLGLGALGFDKAIQE